MSEVRSLHLHVRRGEPMRRVTSLDLTARQGVHGGRPTAVDGPRQVLVASGEVLDELGLAEDALRADIVAQGVDLDDRWRSGQVLEVGSARLRLTYRCEVCSRLAATDAVRSVLGRSALKALHGRRGFLAVVVDDGEVNEADALAIIGSGYPAVPDASSERIAWLVRQVPPGRVVTYADLCALSGEPPSKVRSLGHLLERLGRQGVPVHRVVRADGSIFDRLAETAHNLVTEGVQLAQRDDRALVVDCSSLAWRPAALYRRREDGV